MQINASLILCAIRRGWRVTAGCLPGRRLAASGPDP
jgi:hypothetical protein